MFAVALTFLWLKVLGCPGICMLMDCYQGREGGEGCRQVDCHLVAESFSEALNMPGHLIQG